MYRLCFRVGMWQLIRDVITTPRQAGDTNVDRRSWLVRRKRSRLSSSRPKHNLEVHTKPSLLCCITFLRIARQSPHIIHEIPNVIRSLHVTKSRHSGEADSILDDPKQLLVGVALHLLACEIGCAWIHPLPRRSLCPAIVGMTDAAIESVVRAASFNACFGVLGARRNSVPASAVNEITLGQIGQARFSRPRLMQRRQIKTHERNPDQHHSKHDYRPQDSLPHLLSPLITR